MKLLVSELFLKTSDFVVEMLVHSLLGFGETDETIQHNCGFLWFYTSTLESTLLCKIPAIQLCRSS